MRRFTLMAAGVVGAISLFAMAEEQPSDPARIDRLSRDRAQSQPDELTARTYAVADFVVITRPASQSSDNPQPAQSRFDDLIACIQRDTGAKAWERNGVSMKPYAETLSLVIRQTPDVHAQISKLGQLRKSVDEVQVMCQLTVIAGPWRQIAELAAQFPGELGRAEQEDLLDAVKKSGTLNIVTRPQVRTLNHTTATISIAGKSSETAGPVLATHFTVADDRRSIRLKIAAAPRNAAAALLSNVQILNLHDGRTAAIHFESERVVPALPPSDDTEELMVIVTPRIIVRKEDEVMFTVTPRIIESGTEEELLGIPVR